MNVTILTKSSNGSLWVFLDSFNHDKIPYYIVSDATDFKRSIERADKFDMTGEALIRKSVRDPTLVGKVITYRDRSTRPITAHTAKCLAHFTGLFGSQYVAVKDSTGFKIVPAEYCVVVPDILALEGGEYAIYPTRNSIVSSGIFLDPALQSATANGLCYPTKESAEAAMADIVRFCRLRRLAEMVNGDGDINSMVQCDYGTWSYTKVSSASHTVDKIFTESGAVKACDLLSSGKFKL